MNGCTRKKKIILAAIPNREKNTSLSNSVVCVFTQIKDGVKRVSDVGRRKEKIIINGTWPNTEDDKKKRKKKGGVSFSNGRDERRLQKRKKSRNDDNVLSLFAV